ncbi:hypothetical protein OKW41_002701 [Paraburkholderia sp. UCT70]|uniref:alpha/beta fold hydrolase n=1 Tax=Paraburkholderia sp. UCT70 TaxID=2991068 RepID=UPI003D205497
MIDTHFTAPTRFVEVDGDRFAYRRWGNTRTTDQPPLFFPQHFRGGMDHWDRLMTDGLAAGPEVILYNGRGIANPECANRTKGKESGELDVISLSERCGKFRFRTFKRTKIHHDFQGRRQGFFDSFGEGR